MSKRSRYDDRDVKRPRISRDRDREGDDRDERDEREERGNRGYNRRDRHEGHDRHDRGSDGGRDRARRDGYRDDYRDGHSYRSRQSYRDRDSRERQDGHSRDRGQNGGSVPVQKPTSEDALKSADALLAQLRQKNAPRAKQGSAPSAGAGETVVMESEESRPNPYFDPTFEDKSLRSRKLRGLQFNPQGKFIELANEQRHQEHVELEAMRIEAERVKSGESANMVIGEGQFKPSRPPPIEWWDVELLGTGGNAGGTADDSESLTYQKLSLLGELAIENRIDRVVTDLVQHPVLIDPPTDSNGPGAARIHMTKQEMKRLRKNTRAEKHKEQQDRIRLGLDPAPPPKLKPSNVMSVYAHEAIKDPTRMEMKAKQAVAERKQKHDDDNENRKLTSEERWDKALAKIDREKAKGIFAAVFRIESLIDGKHKFVVNYNAIKSQFTGMTIFNSEFNLVIVEGGFLQIKKYAKMLLTRTQWTVAAPPRTDEEAATEPPDLSSNSCTLVWMGELKAAKFRKWTVHNTETEQDAKDLLARNGAESYWIEARSLATS